MTETAKCPMCGTPVTQISSIQQNPGFQPTTVWLKCSCGHEWSTELAKRA